MFKRKRDPLEWEHQGVIHDKTYGVLESDTDIQDFLYMNTLTSPAAYRDLSEICLRRGMSITAIRILKTSAVVFPDQEGIVHFDNARDRALRSADSPRAFDTKIFGIGLSRTGTLSMSTALQILGFESQHFENQSGSMLDWGDVMDSSALSDTPISSIFEPIYYAFPNAYFIYTERNVDAWVTSMKGYFTWLDDISHLRNLCIRPNDEPSIVSSPHWRFIHLALYGNYSTWAEAYRGHEARVIDFFASRPKTHFLRIDITDDSTSTKDKWTSLANFLGLEAHEIPLMPFPHGNSRDAIASAT